MKTDALDYLNDPIPIVWLDVCDRLTLVGADEPLLTVSSPATTIDEDSVEMATSVVTLMREAGALEGCRGNRQAERERARAMLQFMHKLGVVIYFDDVPGMENKVVLGPQWIIDNITPGFGEWEVKDPIGAGRCPDVFTRPKRSAED